MGKSNEPMEWAAGTEKAREARASVAAAVAELIVERDITGDRSVVARRLRELLEAERRGDPHVTRAAAMELSVAAAAWVVAMDLARPPREPVPAVR